MLTSICVQSFKSLGDVTLHLDNLTLLIGWNASGKSNVLEALSLLCWAARAPRLTDLPHAMTTGQLRLRGNVTDLVPMGSRDDVITFRCEYEPATIGPFLQSGALTGRPLGPLSLDFALKVSAKDVRVEHESLRAPWVEDKGYRTPLYQATATPGGRLSTTYQNFRRATKPSVECVADQPCFVQLSSPAHFPDRYAEAREVIPLASRQIRAALSMVRFLDPDPRAMRSYAFVDDAELRSDGANVSAVLRHLVDAGRKDEVLAFVADLPEQRLGDLSFLDTPRNEVMVALHEAFGTEPDAVPAALLSDGTLRVLAVAAVLLSAEPGSLVIIEEIDNGVHPSRASALLNSILDTARRRKVRVLLTTHNPALQDALAEEVLPSVTLAWRDPSDGRTRLSRLGELEAFPRMVASGPLGQLVTRQSFEKMVKEPQPRIDLDAFFGVADKEPNHG